MGKVVKIISIGDKINNCKVINFISGTTSKNRKWEVLCECGSKYIEREETLKHQDPMICNCFKYKKLINNYVGNFFIKDFDVNLKKYLVKCKCGKESYKSKYQVYNTDSCGCLNELDLTNKKYERLLYLEKVDKKWKVLCDCGSIKYYNAKKFGKIKSCGCLGKEKAKETINIAIKAKYKDEFSSLRKRYKCHYSDGDISFEEFYKLSQMDCYYCGIKPSNLCKNRNLRLGKDISYNGLDRINNSLAHTRENVVPCCKTCNFGKSDMSYDEFINLVKRIQVNEIVKYNLITIEKKHYKLFKNYKANYSDGLSFEEFITLSQQKCFYCGIEPSSYNNCFFWNGVDRLNSNLDHNINNCVPCCKHCNRFKRDLSLEDFYNHVNKIKAYLKLNA